jgi:hypothetical protein
MPKMKIKLFITGQSKQLSTEEACIAYPKPEKNNKSMM